MSDRGGDIEDWWGRSHCSKLGLRMVLRHGYPGPPVSASRGRVVGWLEGRGDAGDGNPCRLMKLRLGRWRLRREMVTVESRSREASVLGAILLDEGKLKLDDVFTL
jgi:hypothetical protein